LFCSVLGVAVLYPLQDLDFQAVLWGTEFPKSDLYLAVDGLYSNEDCPYPEKDPKKVYGTKEYTWPETRGPETRRPQTRGPETRGLGSFLGGQFEHELQEVVAGRETDFHDSDVSRNILCNNGCDDDGDLDSDLDSKLEGELDVQSQLDPFELLGRQPSETLREEAEKFSDQEVTK
jgi:hypothetical protein